MSCYELGHQPFSLASPLAFLAHAGIAASAIDTSVEPLDDGPVRDATLVAISAPMHTALRLGQDIARRVRRVNPGAHVAFYGLYAWLNAEYLFEAGLADSVIGGEFEQPLASLARALQAGGTADGVRYPNRYAPPSLDRQAWLTPRREGLPALERYARFESAGTAALAGYVEATRGCKHTCSHCPITPVYQGRFLAIPREVVLSDIRAQVAAGARHITFGDPDFLNGPTHSLKLVRALHQEFPDVTFDATIKIEHILRHAELLPEMRSLGCAFIVSAVESLSDSVLAHLRKGHSAADVGQALDIAAAAGLPLRPSLVAFTPWTSLEDYVALLHFVQAHDLIDSIDPVQYAIRLLIPPASAILDEPDASAWVGELDAAALSYRWAHPDPRMDALHEQVSAIVKGGEMASSDPWQTFGAISAAAHRASGLDPVAGAPPDEGRQRPPRLSESWFC